MLRNILLSMIIHLSGLVILLFIFFLIPTISVTFWNSRVTEFVDPLILHVFTDWLLISLEELPVDESISRIVAVTFYHVAFYMACVFLAFSGLYAFGTLFFQKLQIRFPKKGWGGKRYSSRNLSQRIFGWLLIFSWWRCCSVALQRYTSSLIPA